MHRTTLQTLFEFSNTPLSTAVFEQVGHINSFYQCDSCVHWLGKRVTLVNLLSIHRLGVSFSVTDTVHTIYLKLLLALRNDVKMTEETLQQRKSQSCQRALVALRGSVENNKGTIIKHWKFEQSELNFLIGLFSSAKRTLTQMRIAHLRQLNQ